MHCPRKKRTLLRFRITLGTLTDEGDFSSLSDSLKRKIFIGNFTVYPSYTHKKTRLSHDFYKDTDAIVVGVEDPDVCRRGQLQNFVNLINKTV
jgi:hypothetical protein